MISQELQKRITEEAIYMMAHCATIRQTAEAFNVPKTTVHYDLTKRLKKINVELYEKVREVLDYNTSQRAIRGGHATRAKFKK